MGTELLVTFVSDFLLATMLWLGLWLFRIKPAHAAALEANQTAWVNCIAGKDEYNNLKDKIQAENKQIDAKLKEVLLGCGRCIRSQKSADAQEKGQPNAP